MIELGQLERRHEDFAKRNARVVVASLEEPEAARKTQAQFPHVVVLADHDRNLANAAEVIHARSTPEGGDTSAPTTIIIGPDGNVRWLYRPSAAIVRNSPDELLRALAN
ncbi:MAG: redoxin domain-containing protein [Pirellulales bacterium]